MDEREFQEKYLNLRILKSVQEYLKSDSNSSTAVFPIRVPDDLLFQLVRVQGAENADKTIHQIFKIGLSIWSEKLYNEVFGSPRNLESFIELVKRRMRE
jgi:hypothetical protein